MIASGLPLALLAVALSVLLTPCLCAQKVPPCADDIWHIGYEPNAEEGHAELVITVPDISEKIESVTSILTCTDLQVNGTGKSVLHIDQGQNTTVFQISVPDPEDVAEFEAQGGWQTHHCVLQLTYLSQAASDTDMDEVECEVKLLTVLGRILPRCNLMKAQPLLKHVEVSKDLGQVLLHFHNSGNEVYTHDSKCELGSIDEHDHTAATEENMIPLAPPGADSPIIDIDFYPDCENKTVFEQFKEREMSNCHLEIYQVCQEGHQLVKYVELDFDEGALKCEVPKSALQTVLESLELLLFIDSRPVVGLLLFLSCNISLYLLLIPITICKVSRCCRKPESEVAEEKRPLLENPQTPPVSPTAPEAPPITLTPLTPSHTTQ